MYICISLGHTALLLAEPAHGEAAVTSIGSTGLKRRTHRPQRMPEAVTYTNSLKSYSAVFLTSGEKRKAGFPFGEALPIILNRIFIQLRIHAFFFFVTNMPGKDFTLKFPSSLQNLNDWLTAWYSSVNKDFSEGSQTVVGTSDFSFLT